MTHLFCRVLNADVPPIPKCSGNAIDIQENSSISELGWILTQLQKFALLSRRVNCHPFRFKFITDHCNKSSETAQRCTQIHYRPLQSIFRNSPEMHTTSLPTTAINLQKLPKDAHKSPPKTVLGNFKGFSPITTWAKVAQGVHCKLGLRLDLTHTSALCYSLNLNMWLNVSASNINQNAICNEAGTLHLFRWKRKMSQPSCSSLLLYI